MGDITVILVIFSDKLVPFLCISEYTHMQSHTKNIHGLHKSYQWVEENEEKEEKMQNCWKRRVHWSDEMKGRG